jgi:hypothetical protein
MMTIPRNGDSHAAQIESRTAGGDCFEPLKARAASCRHGPAGDGQVYVGGRQSPSGLTDVNGSCGSADAVEVTGRISRTKLLVGSKDCGLLQL